VETLVDQARSRQPRQVEIRVTMMEVQDATLGELGYDWLVAPFNVGASDKLFGSAGVSGNSSNVLEGGDYPFRTPTGSIVGQQPLTAGLRGISDLKTQETIDNLLGTGGRSAFSGESPGVFAVGGVFTDPQFQVVLRALSQSTGTDVLTAPRTLAKSGQRAKIELIKEFIYPTEFDPPEMPESVGTVSVASDPGLGGGEGDSLAVGDGFAPITPATPTAFEMRPIGMTLEVEPIIGADNRTVDLNLAPEFIEFQGFIDYGSDITQFSQLSGGQPIVTQNDILQPIFRKNALSTSVTVWDGHTVVIGGVVTEEARQINDGVPFLASIPGVGRLFQSEATDIIRRNILFFVTVTIVDPGGNRLNAPLARE
jgi:general secretion pathway protein D